MADSCSFCSHVIVCGVGLIGGSVAAAVRRRFGNCRITGIGRNPQRLAAAHKAGLLDDWTCSISDAVPADDAVVVVCLPVDGIADAVTAIAQTAGDGVLITDAGSVKQAICRRITGPAAARFVGAHPIAGSERSGFESADARLFVDRPCIVTTSAAGAAMETRCRRFWENLGARVTVMSPEEHDRVLAVTSHLPHVLAAVAAACADADLLPFAGTGFRDTTRVAAGDPVLWRQILCANASQVVQTAERAQERLQQLIESLRSGDADGVERLLDEAAGVRRLSSMSARPEPPG